MGSAADTPDTSSLVVCVQNTTSNIKMSERRRKNNFTFNTLLIFLNVTKLFLLSAWNGADIKIGRLLSSYEPLHFFVRNRVFQEGRYI